MASTKTPSHKNDLGVANLNVKQLLRLDSQAQDNFFLDGKQIYQVKLVCRVLSLEQNEIQYRFTLSDHGATFPGVYYQSDEAAFHYNYIHNPNNYAVIYGVLRNFQGQVNLLINAIKNCNDVATVMRHRTVVTWEHLHRTGKIQTNKPAFKPAVMADQTTNFNTSDPQTGAILNAIMQLQSNPTDGASKQDILGVVGKMGIGPEELVMKLNEMTMHGLVFGGRGGNYCIT